MYIVHVKTLIRMDMYDRHKTSFHVLLWHLAKLFVLGLNKGCGSVIHAEKYENRQALFDCIPYIWVKAPKLLQTSEELLKILVYV